MTSLAVNSELMKQETASIFVAGGALTVAIFPFLANLVGRKNSKTVDESDPQKKSDSDEDDKEEESQEL